MKRIMIGFVLVVCMLTVSGCSKINQHLSKSFFDGGTKIVMFVESEDSSCQEIDKIVSIIKDRLKNLGIIVKPGMITHEKNTINLNLPFTKYTEVLTSSLVRNPSFNLRLLSDDLALINQALAGDILSGYELLTSMDGTKFLVRQKEELTEIDVAKAEVQSDQFGQPVIGVKFRNYAKNKLFELTKAYKGKRLAVIVDGAIVMAPRIQEEIKGGEVQITGRFSSEEVKTLVVLLNSTSYPAPVRINAVGKLYE